jgi:hypothetical protein
LLDLVATCFPEAPPLPSSAHWNDALQWLRDRDATLASHNVLVVVDEVERVQDGIKAGWCSTDFLDFLRAAGDSLKRIRFLLLTAYPLERLGWLDRLISSTIRNISYLDATSARNLIREPIPAFPDIYPEGGVERILRETRCHPFLIQKVCDELCKHLNEHGRRRATDEELTAVFDRVTEEKLFAELWSQRTPKEQKALHPKNRRPCTASPVLRGRSTPTGSCACSRERAMWISWVCRPPSRFLSSAPGSGPHKASRDRQREGGYRHPTAHYP